jgi:hypothetical protein
MTLDEVCKVGQDELDNFQGFTPSPARKQVQPIAERFSADSANDITEQLVRSMSRRVLNALAALPQGTWTTTAPSSGNLGGVEHRAIQKGNLALTFRLQYDGDTMKTVLWVGGYITEEKKATVGS